MDLHQEAENHLRTIRLLMERATIYRAISAPTACVGGLIGTIIGFMPGSWLPMVPRPWDFKAPWLAALLITTAMNAWFIRRDALRRGDAFISPGMRLALRSLLPPMLCGAVVGVLLEPPLLPMCWMVFYGLALLATAPFAPRSIAVLGWTFLVSGLAYAIALATHLGPAPDPRTAMGTTFGIFHLIYAACISRTFPAARESRATD